MTQTRWRQGFPHTPTLMHNWVTTVIQVSRRAIYRPPHRANRVTPTANQIAPSDGRDRIYKPVQPGFRSSLLVNILTSTNLYHFTMSPVNPTRNMPYPHFGRDFGEQ